MTLLPQSTRPTSIKSAWCFAVVSAAQSKDRWGSTYCRTTIQNRGRRISHYLSSHWLDTPGRWQLKHLRSPQSCQKTSSDVSSNIKQPMVVGWVFSPIITATIPRYGSVVQLQVHKLFWEAILDYRSGYRKLDVKRAIALKSVYAIRFYELFSGKTEPIIYPVAKLKEMFAIGTNTSRLMISYAKVIEPAKERGCGSTL